MELNIQVHPKLINHLITVHSSYYTSRSFYNYIISSQNASLESLIPALIKSTTSNCPNLTLNIITKLSSIPLLTVDQAKLICNAIIKFISTQREEMPYTKTWRYLRHLLNYLHEMKEDIYIDYKVFFFSFIFHEVTMNYEFRKIYKKAGKFYMKYYTQDDYDFIKKEALKYLNHAAGLRHVQIGYDIISFFAPVDFIRKDKQLQERLFEIVEHVPNAFAAHCKLFYMILYKKDNDNAITHMNNDSHNDFLLIDKEMFIKSFFRHYNQVMNLERNDTLVEMPVKTSSSSSKTKKYVPAYEQLLTLFLFDKTFAQYSNLIETYFSKEMTRLYFKLSSSRNHSHNVERFAHLLRCINSIYFVYKKTDNPHRMQKPFKGNEELYMKYEYYFEKYFFRIIKTMLLFGLNTDVLFFSSLLYRENPLNKADQYISEYTDIARIFLNNIDKCKGRYYSLSSYMLLLFVEHRYKEQKYRRIAHEFFEMALDGVSSVNPLLTFSAVYVIKLFYISFIHYRKTATNKSIYQDTLNLLENKSETFIKRILPIVYIFIKDFTKLQSCVEVIYEFVGEAHKLKFQKLVCDYVLNNEINPSILPYYLSFMWEDVQGELFDIIINDLVYYDETNEFVIQKHCLYAVNDEMKKLISGIEITAHHQQTITFYANIFAQISLKQDKIISNKNLLYKTFYAIFNQKNEKVFVIAFNLIVTLFIHALSSYYDTKEHVIMHPNESILQFAVDLYNDIILPYETYAMDIVNKYNTTNSKTETQFLNDKALLIYIQLAKAICRDYGNNFIRYSIITDDPPFEGSKYKQLYNEINTFLIRTLKNTQALLEVVTHTSMNINSTLLSQQQQQQPNVDIEAPEVENINDNATSTQPFLNTKPNAVYVNNLFLIIIHYAKNINRIVTPKALPGYSCMNSIHTMNKVLFGDLSYERDLSGSELSCVDMNYFRLKTKPINILPTILNIFDFSTGQITNHFLLNALKCCDDISSTINAKELFDTFWPIYVDKINSLQGEQNSCTEILAWKNIILNTYYLIHYQIELCTYKGEENNQKVIIDMLSKYLSLVRLSQEKNYKHSYSIYSNYFLIVKNIKNDFFYRDSHFHRKLLQEPFLAKMKFNIPEIPTTLINDNNNTLSIDSLKNTVIERKEMFRTAIMKFNELDFFNGKTLDEFMKCQTIPNVEKSKLEFTFVSNVLLMFNLFNFNNKDELALYNKCESIIYDNIIDNTIPCESRIVWSKLMYLFLHKKTQKYKQYDITVCSNQNDYLSQHVNFQRSTHQPRHLLYNSYHLDFICQVSYDKTVSALPQSEPHVHIDVNELLTAYLDMSDWDYDEYLMKQSKGKTLVTNASVSTKKGTKTTTSSGIAIDENQLKIFTSYLDGCMRQREKSKVNRELFKEYISYSIYCMLLLNYISYESLDINKLIHNVFPNKSKLYPVIHLTEITLGYLLYVTKIKCDYIKAHKILIEVFTKFYTEKTNVTIDNVVLWMVGLLFYSLNIEQIEQVFLYKYEQLPKNYLLRINLALCDRFSYLLNEYVFIDKTLRDNYTLATKSIIDWMCSSPKVLIFNLDTFHKVYWNYLVWKGELKSHKDALYGLTPSENYFTFLIDNILNHPHIHNNPETIGFIVVMDLLNGLRNISVISFEFLCESINVLAPCLGKESFKPKKTAFMTRLTKFIMESFEYYDVVSVISVIYKYISKSSSKHEKMILMSLISGILTTHSIEENINDNLIIYSLLLKCIDKCISNELLKTNCMKMLVQFYTNISEDENKEIIKSITNTNTNNDNNNRYYKMYMNENISKEVILFSVGTQILRYKMELPEYIQTLLVEYPKIVDDEKNIEVRRRLQQNMKMLYTKANEVYQNGYFYMKEKMSTRAQEVLREKMKNDLYFI